MVVTARRALFVAGAGTEVGKTYVTASLTRRLRDQGRAVKALKPLASGVPAIDDPAFAGTDTAILLAAQGLPITLETVEACSPWRFLAPLAPDQAAAREARSLSLDELVAWCEARFSSNPRSHLERPKRSEGLEGGLQGSLGWREPSFQAAALAAAPQDERRSETTLLIEGVGGLMSPITEDATGLDWLKRLGLPALLVSGSYLGAISHALTAVETLRAHGVLLAGVLVSQSEVAATAPEVVSAAIARRVAAPVAVMNRGGQFPDALADII